MWTADAPKRWAALAPGTPLVERVALRRLLVSSPTVSAADDRGRAGSRGSPANAPDRPIEFMHPTGAAASPGWRVLFRVARSVASSSNACAYECAYRLVSAGCLSPQFDATWKCCICSTLQFGATQLSLFSWTFNPRSLVRVQHGPIGNACKTACVVGWSGSRRPRARVRATVAAHSASPHPAAGCRPLPLVPACAMGQSVPGHAEELRGPDWALGGLRRRAGAPVLAQSGSDFERGRVLQPPRRRAVREPRPVGRLERRPTGIPPRRRSGGGSAARA
jgi:hypothetical protein